MKVDLRKLRAIANAGDPKDKVAVNRAYLKAVLEELEDLQRIRNAEALKAKDPMSDIFKGLFGRPI